ncbi:MAG: flagellar biosynthesis protein FlhF [Methylotenera sp.]|nr:flagellar biosynthesis protein FlhF [Methylotenera sp.]
MNLRQFFGKNSREALNMVRMALGDNAVILSNRAVDGGNKIIAFKEEELDAIVDNESYHRHVTGSGSNETSTLVSVLNQKVEGFHSNQVEPFKAALNEPEAIFKPSVARHTQASHIQEKSAPIKDIASQQMTEMLGEMRNMRSVIESQLTSIAWGNIQQRDPEKSQTLNTLLSAGFSAALSRLLAAKMPANLDASKAIVWIKSILKQNLLTIETESELLDEGGVFALIGPTGVGKTTTTAKLAARYVMKHGTQNLGIITTDAYRIGGHEQLRIYGKILGVMVHAVKDEADLKIALSELKSKHTILIDTVGLSQRDRMVAEQVDMLSNTNSRIKKLLCLNATSTGETLTDVIRAYKGKGLDGCIITKLDEAATIGSALDVMIRGKLKLYYVANGQRVPEDIHMANKQYLIEHALKQGSITNKPFQFQPDELPLIMGQAA